MSQIPTGTTQGYDMTDRHVSAENVLAMY